MNIASEGYYRVTFEDFDLDISFDPRSNHENITLDKDINLDNKDILNTILTELKQYHYYAIRNKYTDDEMEQVYNVDMGSDNMDWDDIVNIVWNHDNPTYTPLSIKKLSSCEGCRMEAPGQMDHMDIGGCMYDP